LENKKTFRIILGNARHGKTYKLCELIHNDIVNGIPVALYTQSHANRLKICKSMHDMYGDNIYNISDVQAAIDYKQNLWTDADNLYIDELGLFNSQHGKNLWVNCVGKKNIAVNGDVHQIQNSDWLHTFIMEGLKQGGKKALDKYNAYVNGELWGDLVISQRDVKAYKRLYRNVDVEIVYATPEGDYKPNRALIDLWEREGDSPFINKIGLNDVIEYLRNGGTDIQVLTTTSETREKFINMVESDWINNIKIGSVVFCKENKRCALQRRTYFNGEYYKVVAIDGYKYTLNKIGDAPGGYKGFCVSRSELAVCFQPPYCICVAKGQGTDFKHAIFYVEERDVDIVDKKMLYTCVSRAREKYDIIVNGNYQVVNRLLIQGKYIRMFDTSTRSAKKINYLDDLHYWFSREVNKHNFTCIKDIYKAWREYRADGGVTSYQNFTLDFKMLFPEYKPAINNGKQDGNITVASEKGGEKSLVDDAETTVKKLIDFMLSEAKNNNLQRLNMTMSNLLNINELGDLKNGDSRDIISPYIVSPY
jgi:hypothetical protein